MEIENFMNRRKAREYAFILIFQYKFQPDEIHKILDEFIEEYNPGNQEEYIRDAVLGVVDNADKIDEMIANYSEGWEIERISVVNRSILRLAICEMLYIESVPGAVAVNEAVGLAKIYDGEESLAFVNGILDKIKNDLN